MAQILNLQFFDDAKNGWGLRRVKSASPLPQHAERPSYTLVHINLGINSNLSHEDRVKSLVHGYLSASEPTFVSLTEVTHEVYNALSTNTWVRANYAMTEHQYCIGPALDGEGKDVEIEQTGVVLVRLGINIDFVESLAKQFVPNEKDAEPQPVLALHMRNFLNLGFHTLCVLHVDPTKPVDKRLGYLAPVMDRIGEKENVIICGNFYQHTQPGTTIKDFKFKMNWEKGSQKGAVSDFPDVVDCGSCTKALLQSPQESSVWFRSKDARLLVEKVQLLSLDDKASNIYQSAVMCRFTSNPGYSSNSAGVSGANTTSNSQSPERPREVPQAPLPASTSPSGFNAVDAGKNPAFVDPNAAATGSKILPQAAGVPMPRSATVSASGEGGVNLGQLFGGKAAPVAPAGTGVNPSPPAAVTASPSRKWNASNMAALTRRASSNLSETEKEYDVGSRFSTVGQAVEQLNNGSVVWNRDYIIIHNTLLACVGINPSLDNFKKYSAVNPPPGPAATAAAPTTTTRTPASTLSAQGRAGCGFSSSAISAATPASLSGAHLPQQGQERARVWSERACTIIYQVTPREMVFDISQDIGLAPNALKKAIDKLNASNRRAQSALDALTRDPKDRLATYKYDYALLYSREHGAHLLLAALDVPCDINSCRAAALSLAGSPL